MIGKENLEKLKVQHPDIFKEYATETENRIFRLKKGGGVMLKGKRAYICSPLSAKTREERMLTWGLRRRIWIRSARYSTAVHMPPMPICH